MPNVTGLPVRFILKPKNVSSVPGREVFTVVDAAATTENSKLPGTDETFFGLRMNITGSPVIFGKKDYKKNMITQMTQPVKRKYDVLLERKIISMEVAGT